MSSFEIVLKTSGSLHPDGFISRHRGVIRRDGKVGLMLSRKLLLLAVTLGVAAAPPRPTRPTGPKVKNEKMRRELLRRMQDDGSSIVRKRREDPSAL
jgi:hypothetical protein